MRADGPAAARAPGPNPTALAARGPGAFGVALARAQARGGRLPGGTLPGPSLAATTLARRRRGADDAEAHLGERREEAEPGRPGAVVAGLAPTMQAAQDVRSPDAPGRAALLPPSALERLAVEAGRAAARASLDLRFGPSLDVRLTRSLEGVDLLLRPGAGLRAAAEAELPGLVAALRARGISVARAECAPKGQSRPPWRAR